MLLNYGVLSKKDCKIDGLGDTFPSSFLMQYIMISLVSIKFFYFFGFFLFSCQDKISLALFMCKEVTQKK